MSTVRRIAQAGVQNHLFYLVAVFGAALLRAVSFMHDDIYWFVILAQRTLQGAKPYVDFIDSNTPASIIIYMPAVLLSEWTGIGVMAALTLMIVAVASFVVAYSIHCLERADVLDQAGGPTIATFLLFCLVVASAGAFGQREHVALIAITPVLSVYTLRQRHHDVPLALAVLGGLGGALCAAIKPFFAIPIILAFVASLRGASVREFRHRLLATENLVAAIGAASYAIACWRYFPAYTTRALPLAFEVYAPVRMSLLAMLLSWPFVLLGIGSTLCVWLAAGRLFRHPSHLFFVAALGFGISWLLQAKGYPYQSAPALLLLLFVASWLLADRIAEGGWSPTRRLGLGGATSLLVMLLIADMAYSGFAFRPPKIFAEIARLTPHHPRVASITNMMRGPQIAELMGGVWVESTPNSWISQYIAGWNAGGDYVSPFPRANAAAAAFGQMDKNMFVDSLVVGKPDVIFVDRDKFSSQLLSDPAISKAFRSYRLAETFDGEALWIRRTRR
jgi:hypothetical protein